jgi:hypothetical protein
MVGRETRDGKAWLLEEKERKVCYRIHVDRSLV